MLLLVDRSIYICPHICIDMLALNNFVNYGLW